MSSTSIHQAIHGYREGHRLLSSSLSLNADSARAMLVLSDMSGPSMHPGFDEYLTGYPLPGSELFVFAKTWYAPEMQRPGCVWTHSLLLTREQVSAVSATRLLSSLRRPQTVESAATTPIEVDGGTTIETDVDDIEDTTVAASLAGAVLGQARPVIVTVETARQLEMAILQLWEELWPAAKARFSFCTGALMPRSVAGVLMDLQAVPRAIPSSQFRKSAGAALVIDLRTPTATEPWVPLFLESAKRGDAMFRTWLEAAAGGNVVRSVVPSLAPIFGEWHAPDSSARSILVSVMRAKDLDPSARSRLIGMVFDRAEAEAGAPGRRELLQDLCGRQGIDSPSVATMLKGQIPRLFDQSRAEGIALILSLVGAGLTELGESVLRAALLLLVPDDLVMFGDAQGPYLPTIVGMNPRLAFAPVLWGRVGGRSAEVLEQLGAANLSEEDRGVVVDAIISARCDVSMDALARFGGKAAIFRWLTVLASGEMQLSGPWRFALSAQPDVVLQWLESISSPLLRDLEFSTRFLSPKATQSRLAKVWKSGTASAGSIGPRVASFGLTLAFWESNVSSLLLAKCFQPTYDAAGSSRLDVEEWEWLREQAPALAWYGEWDRCERLAAALAKLLVKSTALLSTFFGIVHSRQAIEKVVTILDGNKDTRPYLKSLRKVAESSPIGTVEQRNALLKH